MLRHPLAPYRPPLHPVSPLEPLVYFDEAAALLGVVVEHLVVLREGEEPVSALLRQLRAAETEKQYIWTTVYTSEQLLYKYV